MRDILSDIIISFIYQYVNIYIHNKNIYLLIDEKEKKTGKNHGRNLARMTNVTHFSPLRRKSSLALGLHRQLYSL